MCTAIEAALALYSQKMWMKNRSIQHSGRFNFIQMPFFGFCGISGLMEDLYNSSKGCSMHKRVLPLGVQLCQLAIVEQNKTIQKQ
jgi:hypothetical protein